MRRVSRLAKRYSVYYLRCPIPRGLQAILGRREINRSLKTTDRKIAVERLLILSLQIDRLFGELLEMMSNASSLPAEIQSALGKELWESRETWPWVMVRSEQERIAHCERFAQLIQEAELKQHNQAECILEASNFLDRHKLYDLHGKRMKATQLVRLGHLSLRASISKWKYGLARLSGANDWEIGDPELRDLMQVNVETLVSHARQPVITPVQKVRTPLEELFKRYRAENAHTMKANRAYDFEQAFRMLAETVGPEVVAEDIDKTHIRKVKDVLAHLPINARKNARFKDLPYPEISETNKTLGLKVISDRSRNRMLGCLNQLMGWATREGFVQQNPVSGMLLKLSKEKSDRLPFDKDDLKRIFNSPTFVGMQSERGWKHPGTLIVRDSNYWMPLLGLCTGARSNELLQLRKCDIRQEEGIWIFDLADEDEKRGKNKNAFRKVPVHPELISLGFVDWVVSSKLKSDERLFSEVKAADSDGKYSTTYSKRFGRFKFSLGITSKDKVFHSFRHLFVDLLRARADDGVLKAIIGHEDGSVTSLYGKGYPLQRLQEAVSAVVLPVDLSHLHAKRMKAAS